MSNSYDVMISYSSADDRLTDEIVDAIESRGFRCWRASRDARAGEDYEEEIVSAIENTRAVVLVFSHTSNESPHVHREIVLADSESKMVFPLRVEDVEPTGRMRYQLSNRQRLDYFRDKTRAIETIHARLLALGCTPNRPAPDKNPGPGNRYGSAQPVPVGMPPPPPRSTDVIPESSDGLRHFLPPALDPLFLLFDWRGRIGRRSYFFGALLELFFFVLSVIVVFYSLLWVHAPAKLPPEAAMDPNATASAAEFLIFALVVVFAILLFAFLICNFCLAAKRLHDLGFSAWWCLAPLGAQLLSLLVSYLSRGRLEALFIEGEIGLVAALFSLWMLMWPGKVARNKYGPAPNFKHDWKPYNEVVTRASARSEFDIPFIALSFDGRIGQKGVATGLVIILWFCAFAANIGVHIDNTGSAGRVFMAIGGGLAGLLRGGLIGEWPFILEVISICCAVLAFICVVSKRLHDLNLSNWLIAPGVLVFGAGVAIIRMSLPTADGSIFLAAALAMLSLLTGALFFWPGDKDFNGYGPPPGFRATVLRTPHTVHA